MQRSSEIIRQSSEIIRRESEIARRESELVRQSSEIARQSSEIARRESELVRQSSEIAGSSPTIRESRRVGIAYAQATAPAMKLNGEFMKSTLVSGVLVILPLALVLMIVLKIIEMIGPLATPIVAWLPQALRFPALITLLLLFLACLVAGLLAQTRAGRGVGNSLEGAILNRIPGYSMVRSITRRIANVEESEKFAPAFVELEDALVPAFVVEEHADGRYTVFVPSAPTPAVGAIYVMARERVYIVDAPFLNAVRCISTWGVGAAKLVQAMREPEKRPD